MVNLYCHKSIIYSNEEVIMRFMADSLMEVIVKYFLHTFSIRLTFCSVGCWFRTLHDIVDKVVMCEEIPVHAVLVKMKNWLLPQPRLASTSRLSTLVVDTRDEMNRPRVGVVDTLG